MQHLVDFMRGFRSIRASLVLLTLVPSLALTLIWLTAAGGKVIEALDLRSQTSLGQDIAGPGNDLRRNLATERRLTVEWLAEPESSDDALRDRRSRTDAAIVAVEMGAEELDSAPPRVRAALLPVREALEQLSVLRERVDRREASPGEAAGGYTQIIVAQLTAVAMVNAQVPDGPLVARSIPLGSLVNMAEQIQMEDTALSASLPSGRLTPAARAQFVMAAGTQRSLLEVLPTQLSPVDREAVRQITGSGAWQRMAAVEDNVLTGSSGDLPVVAREWRPALDKINSDLAALVQDRTEELVRVQTATADEHVRTGMLLSVFGLLAVIASLLLSWRLTRSLLRRLARLREATVALAEVQLPAIVDRLNRGESVDVSTDSVDLDIHEDELGAVVHAFNSARHTAVSTAVELANTRRGFERAILGIARHTQSLVNQQVMLLDKLEREHHQEPDVLAGLYQLDSQANQIRRYEENLIVISGGKPDRKWLEPALLVDVLRSAAGEVAEYQRVTVECDHRTRIAARGVGDVIHLLAELMENATDFSSREHSVLVRARRVGRSLAIQIEDHGVGMSHLDYARFNDMLIRPPRFGMLALGDDPRLGLFVVSRLAARLGVKVCLYASESGGTVAMVLVPEVLLVSEAA